MNENILVFDSTLVQKTCTMQSFLFHNEVKMY